MEHFDNILLQYNQRCDSGIKVRVYRRYIDWKLIYISWC